MIKCLMDFISNLDQIILSRVSLWICALTIFALALYSLSETKLKNKTIIMIIVCILSVILGFISIINDIWVFIRLTNIN